MERLTGVVAEVAEREVASWPRDEPLRLHPRLQALTLEIILRAVFGVDPGAASSVCARSSTASSSRRHAELHAAVLQRGRRWRRFVRDREEADCCCSS